MFCPDAEQRINTVGEQIEHKAWLFLPAAENLLRVNMREFKAWL